jgi:hypothetical protein
VLWFTNDLREKRKLVRKAERKWRLSLLEVDRLIYVGTKTQYHKEIELARSHFINDALDKASGKPKVIWSVLNRSLARHRKSMLPDTDDMIKLSNDFNTFFLEKSTKLHAAIHSSGVTSMPSTNNKQASHSPADKSLTAFHGVDTKCVERLILKSSRKSCALDPIPTWLIIKCLPSISPVITCMINSALMNGLPDLFKESRVAPLLKKPDLDKSSLNNYRPVSQLPFVSKLIESVVANQIYEYAESNGTLDSQQSAYRHFHSCESALLAVTNSALIAIDSRKVMLLVLLDLTAAFDCVDHAILSQRLDICGIALSAKEWILSYLSGRRQRVCVGVSVSDSLNVMRGVPQGSVLGPLLFIIYLTGLGDVIKSFGIDYIMYADDVQLFITTEVSQLTQSILTMNKCIAAVIEWLSRSMLTLNPVKTECMLFGSPAILKKCGVVSVSVMGVGVSSSSSLRDLGVMLDQSLTYRDQVANIRAQSFMRLRLISRLKRIVSPSHYKMLVNSLVLSNIEFGAPLLYGLPNCLMNRLQDILNAAFRSIYGLRKFDHISALYSEHQWLNIKQRIVFRMGCIIYNILKADRPTYLSRLMTERMTLRPTRSNCDKKFLVPRVSTLWGSRAFQVCAPRIWNDLPAKVQTASSYSAFRDGLLSHLLNSRTAIS